MANRRRPQDPPPIEIKQFTADEIPRGIAILRRRIEEVQSLRTNKVSYNDQRVRNAESNISSSVLDIFGANSPEYQEHQGHSIWQGTRYVGMEPEEIQAGFEAGIPKSIMMLEGLIARLEEKQADLGQDPAGRVKMAFDNMELHPQIADVCADLYRNRHYRNAVLDASLALVNIVKEKSRRHDLDGAPLMRAVFSKNAPVLAFNDLKDQTEQDEQEGMMHLFEGAVQALRNPRAHALADDSPEEALEYIAFLSFLAKKVDQARRTT